MLRAGSLWVERLRRSFANATRARRMNEFLDRMEMPGDEHIVDLGGTPKIWSACSHPLKIAIGNNHSTTKEPPKTRSCSIHEITHVEGDACDLLAFADMSFDIALSNSLIEHVGDRAKQAPRAAEARLLTPCYWVQTPSIWFPIEAHRSMPYWWFRPNWLRGIALRRWRRIMPGWARMIDGVTVVPLRDMRSMFPDGELYVERSFGFSKS